MEVIGEGQDARIVFHNPSALRPSFTKEMARHLAASKQTRLVMNPTGIGRPETIVNFSEQRDSYSETRKLERRIRGSTSFYLDGDI